MQSSTFLLITFLVLESTHGNIPECRVSTLGTDFRGKSVSTTETGRTCQRWDSQFPHNHTFTKDAHYPERSIQHAENYCRNPEPADMGGVWCFTTDLAVRWEYCDVPKCSAYPECKLTEMGTEYRGNIDQTQGGETCAHWGPGIDPVLIENYCRNPDSKPEGPWCYTDVNKTQWDYCQVPFCKPSASCLTTESGVEYVGTYARTETGLPCQRWDDPVPHTSNYTDPELFPDTTVADAADFCRNPGGDKDAPWCNTLEPTVEWEYCDIPVCYCKVSDTGLEYTGTVTVTESGRQCQRWDSQTPHLHNLTDSDRFPDATLDAASNYCRNPDKDLSGPWCFTTDPAVRREPCDIQFCQDDLQQPVRGVRHVLHIGIDGLNPCFVNGPAPNIMNRMASQGAYTLNKGRTLIRSWSGPSWTAILSGSASESTGITFNDWLPPWKGYDLSVFDITPTTGPNVPIPLTFDVLKRQDKNVRTGFFYDWPFLQYLASSGMAGRLDEDHFCDMYSVGYLDCDQFVSTNASKYLHNVLTASENSYTFLYMVNVDETGHAKTWCSDAYLEMVNTIDAEVGALLDVISELTMEDEVLVVLSTDHGGHDYGHGLAIDDDLLIPMFFRGPGIKKNYVLKNEVYNVDIASTILYAMGFNDVYSMTGHVIEEIFNGSMTS